MNKVTFLLAFVLTSYISGLYAINNTSNQPRNSSITHQWWRCLRCCCTNRLEKMTPGQYNICRICNFNKTIINLAEDLIYLDKTPWKCYYCNAYNNPQQSLETPNKNPFYCWKCSLPREWYGNIHNEENIIVIDGSIWQCPYCSVINNPKESLFNYEWYPNPLFCHLCRLTPRPFKEHELPIEEENSYEADEVFNNTYAITPKDVADYR